jgi:hypothetical protein
MMNTADDKATNMADGHRTLGALDTLAAKAAASTITTGGSVPAAMNLGQRGTVDGEPRCSYSEEYTVWAASMCATMWPVLEDQVSATSFCANHI